MYSRVGERIKRECSSRVKRLVSLGIVPEPPLELKVMVEVVSTGAVGVAIFDGVEYALIPNRLMAATTKR